ncbi:hypothetical protein UCD39_17540 [Nitrospirillum sp. BR 11752]|uniref:hypothetical protein n=1 Tax=Nitrospirillum sp. BR 11752 TaxID=3104293 RepID=UPI002EC65086|nr:hypothetical protein [Nitrospirillum sp. BR 11752]
MTAMLQDPSRFRHFDQMEELSLEELELVSGGGVIADGFTGAGGAAGWLAGARAGAQLGAAVSWIGGPAGEVGGIIIGAAAGAIVGGLIGRALED